MELDGSYFLGVTPWDRASDNAIRSAHMVNESLGDPAAPYNQQELVRTSLISGMEGFDYSNPLALTGYQLITPDLRPRNYVDADTTAGVARNVAATPPLGRGAL